MSDQISSPHFQISASVVKQLGEELVSDEVTAIMELVKNSYDASATYVIVEINNKDVFVSDSDLIPQTQLGYVIITDNGSGMGSEDVFNRWLTISMSIKRKEKSTKIFTENERTPLGEKGVGRLSTQRIGNVVDLITGIEKETFNTQISFKWSDFNEETVLDQVEIKNRKLEKKAGVKGTKIIVKELRDLEVWKGDQFNRIIGELSQLILPGSTKGFKVHVKYNNDVLSLDDISSKVHHNAICTYNFIYDEKEGLSINGKIKLIKLRGNKISDYELYTKIIEPDSGKSFYEFLTDRTLNSKEFLDNVDYIGEEGYLMKFTKKIDKELLSLITIPKPKSNNDDLHIGRTQFDVDSYLDGEEKIERIVAEPGPFKGTIYEFSFINNSIQNTFDTFANFKQIVQNQSGIRIYRDGFGIKPYGLEGNDWLKLSAGSTSGTSIYGLRVNNVIGYIEISARENSNLKEKTDREGFMESPFSNNFFRITEKVKDEINSVLEKTRRSYNEFRKFVASENLGLRDLKSTFNDLRNTAKNSQKIYESANKVNIRLYELKDKVEVVKTEAGKKNDDELNFLISETLNYLSDATNIVNELKGLVQSTTRLDEYIDFLQPQIQSLETQLKDFTGLAALGLTAEALSHELSNIVDRLKRLVDRVSKVKPHSNNYFQDMSIFIKDVKGIVMSFRKQLSHLDPALNYVRENKEKFGFVSFVRDLVSFYEERFDKNIGVIVVNSLNDFYVYVNRGRLIQIIDNIILNSEYWLKRKRETENTFKPEIKIEIQSPFVRISDNGFGIQTSIENTIFQPFITTKPHGVGRGLGLFIVQQLLDSIGCTISLLPNRNEEGRRYIFQLNISSIITK